MSKTSVPPPPKLPSSMRSWFFVVGDRQRSVVSITVILTHLKDGPSKVVSIDLGRNDGGARGSVPVPGSNRNLHSPPCRVPPARGMNVVRGRQDEPKLLCSLQKLIQAEHLKGHYDTRPYILFNKDPEQLRRQDARGGKMFGRNHRAEGSAT